MNQQLAYDSNNLYSNSLVNNQLPASPTSLNSSSSYSSPATSSSMNYSFDSSRYNNWCNQYYGVNPYNYYQNIYLNHNYSNSYLSSASNQSYNESTSNDNSYSNDNCTNNYSNSYNSSFDQYLGNNISSYSNISSPVTSRIVSYQTIEVASDQLDYKDQSNQDCVSYNSFNQYQSYQEPQLVQEPTEAKKKDKYSRKHQLPDEAVDIMNEWFDEHLNNPYPTLEEKERLAKQGLITVKQVTAWFSNRRNRSQNTKPKRMKRVLEKEISDIYQELVHNPNKQQIIEKFKNTLVNHELGFNN